MPARARRGGFGASGGSLARSWLLDERESIGVLVGGTYAITGEGYELLSGAGDVELT